MRYKQKDKNLARSRLLSKYKKTMLYTMIKVCMFNKSNDVLKFDIFKFF